jgi:hypothetical protein
MGRPEPITDKTYCTHGFPPLECIACTAFGVCMHGMMPGICLLCNKPVIVAESARRAGFNADGTIANDMKYGDYTKEQIEKLGFMFRTYDLDKVQAKHLFVDLRLMATTLFARGALNDNIRRMIDRFEASMGGEYSDESLTRAVREHESTKRFVEQIRTGLAEVMREHKGNMARLSNKSLELTGRPVFNTASDIALGLTIAINDTWAYEVSIMSYRLCGMRCEGSFRLTLYDHFGLDQPDVEKKYKYLAGFRAWFVLQHLDRFAYRPFVTKVEMTYPFAGHLGGE